MGDELTQMRERLVAQVVAANKMIGDPIAAALRDVPRHLFLPELRPDLAYTDDAIVIQPGVFKKDREEIRTTMAAGFAGPLSGSRATDHPTDVRFLTDDTAVVISEGGIIFPGQDAVTSEGLVRASWVLVRRDGGWRIACYHNSPAS